MSRATLKVITTAAVAPEATFAVPYTSQAQADFTDPQTINVKVYERTFECAVTFGASAATVTWPASAPYDLPAGEYYIDFDLIGGDPLPRDAAQMENQADSEAADVAAMVVDFNLLLDKLKAAGLMAPDA